MNANPDACDPRARARHAVSDHRGYSETTDRLWSHGAHVKLGSRTVAQSERVFGGYELSSKLALLPTGEDPGLQKMGRGFAHRSSIAWLAEQGR